MSAAQCIKLKLSFEMCGLPRAPVSICMQPVCPVQGCNYHRDRMWMPMGPHSKLLLCKMLIFQSWKCALKQKGSQFTLAHEPPPPQLGPWPCSWSWGPLCFNPQFWYLFSEIMRMHDMLTVAPRLPASLFGPIFGHRHRTSCTFGRGAEHFGPIFPLCKPN